MKIFKHLIYISLITLYFSNASAEPGYAQRVGGGIIDFVAGTHLSGMGDGMAEELESKIHELESKFCAGDLTGQDIYIKSGEMVYRVDQVVPLIGDDKDKYGKCALQVVDVATNNLVPWVYLQNITASNKNEALFYAENSFNNKITQCDSKLSKINSIAAELFENVKTISISQSTPAGVTPGKSQYRDIFAEALQACVSITGKEEHCESLGVYFNQVEQRLTARMYINESQWDKLKTEIYTQVQQSINQSWALCYSEVGVNNALSREAAHVAKCNHTIETVLDQNSQAQLQLLKNTLQCR